MEANKKIFLEGETTTLRPQFCLIQVGQIHN